VDILSHEKDIVQRAKLYNSFQISTFTSMRDINNTLYSWISIR